MTFSVQGKVALVTGANRGIGEGFVQTLLQAGAKTIYAAARDISSVQHLVNLAPSVVKAVALDVTKPGQISALASEITELDMLVNNAGIIDPARSAAADAIAFARQEMEVNLFGPMQLTSALIPLLKKSAQGVIINISSIAAISNFPSIGTYSISKAAMHSYTEGLRADLSADGILVAEVCPGPTDTRMAAGMDMLKPAPATVAQKTFAALAAGQLEIFPDDFAKNMYALFRDAPQKLASTFAQMG